jgi:hypothetical protein
MIHECKDCSVDHIKQRDELIAVLAFYSLRGCHDTCDARLIHWYECNCGYEAAVKILKQYA